MVLLYRVSFLSQLLMHELIMAFVNVPAAIILYKQLYKWHLFSVTTSVSPSHHVLSQPADATSLAIHGRLSLYDPFHAVPIIIFNDSNLATPSLPSGT